MGGLSWCPGGQEVVREGLRCFNQIPQQLVQLALDHYGAPSQGG